MSTYDFLAPEWIAAALAIRDEYIIEDDLDVPSVRLNLVVSDVPFGEGTEAASIDTSTGTTVPEQGELEDADATVHLDYSTAHTLLVGRDPQAAMMAFMMGQIRIEGDLAKVMSLQSLPQPDGMADLAREVYERVLEITNPLDQ